MKLSIQKGNMSAMPSSRGKYPFNDCKEIGDGFFVPEKNQSQLSGSVALASKRMGCKFRTIKTEMVKLNGEWVLPEEDPEGDVVEGTMIVRES